MKRLTLNILILAIIAVLAGVSSAQAIDFTFTPFDVPDSTFTEAFGINNSGQMCGVSSGPAGEASFFYNGAGFINFQDPGKTDTEAYGLNNQGQMVGSYQNQVGGAVHGWFYNGAGFSTLDVLGTGLDTFARGINDTGQIVGFTQNQTNFQHHGFLFNGSTISTFDVPFAGVTSTEAFGINNDGQIVGNYSQNGTTFGFIKTGNAFTSFNAADFVPGAIFTQLSDINNNGDLVGFFIDSNLVAHGFFYDGVQFVTLDVSGATQTIANGINDQDMIVGQFLGGTNTHGFLAVDPPGSPNAVVVPLPSTLLLLSSGLLGLGVLRRRWSLKS